MTITQIEQYKSKIADLPEDTFLGSLLWFTIGGAVSYDTEGRRTTTPVRVTRDQLEAWFTELGLDTAFLPPQILKVDAFRKASGPDAKALYAVGSQRAELYVDEVESTPEFVLRHVMRKLRDPKHPMDEAKLTTEWMATLKFYRGGRTSQNRRASGDHFKARIRPGLGAEDQAQVELLLGGVQSRYDDLSQNLTEDKIRSVLRGYLAHLRAIAVKPSGGVYFVYRSHQDAVDALEELIGRISQGCTLDQVPLVDDAKRRSMLTEAFQSEVEDDVRALLAKVADINAKAKHRGGRIAPKTYAELNAAYQTVQERSEEYSKLLGQAMGRAASSLELALDSVMDMAQRIDYKVAK